jgi:putative ABC transport system permease protein
MNWNTVIFRELFRCKHKLITSGLAITLGMAIIVAINTMTPYSEEAVSKELDALGANVLILPPEVSVADYYSADLQTGELPEEYVSLLTTSNIEGVENLSPKLSIPTNINGHQVVMTGILPKNEFQSKASWAGAGVFSRPKICGSATDVFNLNQKSPKETLVRKRVIETLDHNEVLVGHDIAHKLKLNEGEEIAMLEKPFNIAAILPQTGTIDDSRIFAHLHTVQDLTGRGEVVSAIEVVGCCKQVSKGLIANITNLLPDANVMTISQIVDTQVKTNELMRNLSFLFLATIIIMGSAGIANDMYNNVIERRKEIGTLVALGASSGTILKLFLMKALVFGFFGGLFGYILGTIIALIFGPLIAGVTIYPIFSLLFIAVGLSTFIALIASYFPARYAARLDPCTSLQDT